MKYFYARVSTKGQNLARQLDEAERIDGIDRTFCDKESGKTMDRTAYNELKSIVRDGDEVIIKSLDRLGRNKIAVKRELDWFRENGITLRILDIPTTMVQLPAGQEWIMDMVTNIIVEVLASVAQQERVATLQRQAEGIASMPVVDGYKVSKKTGRRTGRPAIKVDRSEVVRLDSMRRAGELSVADCCNQLGVSRSMFYNLVRG